MKKLEFDEYDLELNTPFKERILASLFENLHHWKQGGKTKDWRQRTGECLLQIKQDDATTYSVSYRNMNSKNSNKVATLRLTKSS